MLQQNEKDLEDLESRSLRFQNAECTYNNGLEDNC